MADMNEGGGGVVAVDDTPQVKLTGLDLLRSALAEREAADPRALQVETGASQALGCRAESLWRLLAVPESDSRLRLDALIGKAAHAYVEQALTGREGLLVEHRASYRGVPCTIDLGYVAAGSVVDWKFPRLSKIAYLKKDGIGDRYRAQVHLGGAALRAEGHDIHTVGLVFVPRDGEWEDAWEWSEPFDQTVADAAADRVKAEGARATRVSREISDIHTVSRSIVVEQARREIDREGLRDEDLFFCRTYCGYSSTCRGPEPEAPEPPDDGALEAAQQYAAAWHQQQEAKRLMDEYRPQVERFGRMAVEDATVSWVKPSTRVEHVPDSRTIYAAYELLVGELPTREVESNKAGYVRVTPKRRKR